ncbi:class I SAM-dependent methyltransferase [Veillonella caviae]|uniref:class I SAM-dependent methyltransferase n=1 Tax=Veillonella caviae TaxID=248316 RepID=UPI0023A834E0|nr:class I SAM-dependent methyltransferase [Veillonella caviae]MCI5708126.1 class I SAM-dependent methyltransferase [Veillonella caviae]MDY5715793.1 class I SAM-dependent methyltransferase [Veillonella caviae]
MNDSFNHITHPKEDDKTFITSYWTERAEDFRRLREKELQSPKLILWRNELLQHIGQNERLRILDIGCGAGFFSIILSQLGHTVTGIDITPNMIEESKLLAYSVNSNVEFMVMDAEKLDFDTNDFDVVVARNVTWNLPHPDEAYKEWLRVLKPGGILLNYDAEHAKNHHHLPQSVHHAHEHIKPDLLDKCHTIYHMLSISSTDRPTWDKVLLENMGATVTIDSSVGPRIYAEEDEFYIPVPMFLVKAVK